MIKKEFEKILSEKQDIQIEYDKLNKDKEDFNNQIITERKRLEEYSEKQKKNLKKMREEIDKQIQQNKINDNNLLKENESLKAQITALKADFSLKEKKLISEKNRQYNSIQDLRKRIKELEEKNIHLQEENKSIIDEFEEKKKRYTKLEAKLKLQIERAEEYRKDFERRVNELNGFRDPSSYDYSKPNKSTRRSKSVSRSNKSSLHSSPNRIIPNKINKPETQNSPKIFNYKDGTVKNIYSNGDIFITFKNGDTRKEIKSSKIIIYYYASENTTSTTYPDGTQIIEFPSGQIDKHYKDGRVEAKFPNGQKKMQYPDGSEEWLN